MDWVDNVEPKPAPVEVKPEATPKEVVPETPPAKTEEPPAKVEGTEKKEGESAAKAVEKPEEKSVPQDVMGKALKKQREKLKERIGSAEEKVALLEAENKKLRESGPAPEVDPAEVEQEQKIALKVRQEFLKQQDAYGRKKYGQKYTEAVEVVGNYSKLHKDPNLIAKIQWADDPAETLMAEAARIADEEEFGTDPEIKKKNIREEVRKEIEAEYAEKLKVLGNQPSDVTKMRAAGGDIKPEYQQESWASGKKPLPS